MDENKKKLDKIIGEYQYGFKTESKPVLTTEKGLSEEVVKKISSYKDEPEWMLDYRIKSYLQFKKMKNPNWGPDLSQMDMDNLTYFIRSSSEVSGSWDEVPEEIKETFERLGIPEAERKFLAGVSTQFESEVVYNASQEELKKLGVIFLDTDTALKEHPKLFKKYFGKVVPYSDNKYAALNGAVWSGGTFIYIPKGVKIEKPLQSYFRMNSERMGQFERTLIVVDEGASVHYIEGCTAPIYSKDSLHAATVEVIVEKDAYCRYTTIQNWSSNVYNLVTKRAFVHENGLMEWIDGNMGSTVNMKYPSCILLGRKAKANTISIAFAGKNQEQDSGAKMIHVGPETQSTIISKSISRGGGKVNYRGKVEFGKKAKGAKAHVECDTIILDDHSFSDTIPINIIKNAEGFLEHEATVSKISEDQLFYLMSRGLSEEEATEMIVMGFIEPFTKELPMEYAVELNQLIKIEMEGSIG